jgi:hypothetical protein
VIPKGWTDGLQRSSITLDALKKTLYENRVAKSLAE